jgi:hypothetical protein
MLNSAAQASATRRRGCEFKQDLLVGEWTQAGFGRVEGMMSMSSARHKTRATLKGLC